ncbi:outer membrane protein transport protein [Pendulispora brunnea]|uniref:Outer membrane protein transport protein n=1 Tax=Pendulispora brunnea TaxID=2905690 RepID=A0ABZ2KN33_9BACT
MTAAATPELVTPDPRSLGMGGLGVAAAEDASATHHNPARLQAVTKASFVLGLSGLYAHQEAPLPYPDEPKGTSNIFAPFGMVGGAYRLSPRFVVGLSVLPGSASAGRYELKNGTRNGMELSATAITAEAQLAASFALLDNLWIGVEYRASYVNQTLKTPLDVPGGVFQMKTTLDGFNFLGAAAGIYYEPVRGTGIGFAYRSQMSKDIDGTTDLPTGSYSTHSHAATPDKFTLGISQRLLDDALLLNLQGALVMSPWIDQSTTTTIDTPGAPTSSTTVTNDRTFWEAKMGAEYWLEKQWALRAGVIIGNENARKEYVSPFSSPPSNFYAAPTLGGGVKFDKWLVDAAMWWLIDHGDQVNASQNGAPGDYRRSGFVGMLSLRYSI